MRNQRRERLERADRREANAVISRIVYHAERPDVQPSRIERRSPFVCYECGHVRSLCVCEPARITA